MTYEEIGANLNEAGLSIDEIKQIVESNQKY